MLDRMDQRGNRAKKPEFVTDDNPNVEMFARSISPPPTMIGKCDRTDISEDEMLSGGVFSDMENSAGSERFIMGLAAGLHHPSEFMRVARADIHWVLARDIQADEERMANYDWERMCTLLSE